MANISEASTATSVTGTAAVDTLTLLTNEAPILFEDGDLALTGNNYTVNGGTTATDVEVFNFANGVFSIDASVQNNQFMQAAALDTGIVLTQDDDTTTDGGESIADSSTVFVWNGSSQVLAGADGAPAAFSIASINGVEAEESFELDGLGTVEVDSGTTFDFTVFESYLASFGWGNRGIVEFDVEFANEDDDSFTQTFTLTVEGGATEGADFFNTSNTEDNDSGEGDDGAVILDGLGGDDVILGDEGSDFIFGNDGDDRIFAGAKDGDDVDDAADAGDDIFAGGAGNDFVNGGVGADLLIGDGVGEEIFDVDVDLSADTDGSDTINGGDDDDVIVTGSLELSETGTDDDSAFSVNGGGNYVFDGTDYTVTGDADDQAFGGDGDDLVIGAGGDDLLGGGNGGDDIAGGAGNDRIFGGADDGNDRLFGEGGDDTIFGSDGVDVIRGGADDDVLFNGAGDDEIVNGDSGQDTLWGGAGDDTLNGGADEDTFAFTTGNGNDLVEDFDLSEDSIDFSEIASLSADNIEDFAAEVNGALTIYYAEEASVTVAGATLDDLSSVDFMFA